MSTFDLPLPQIDEARLQALVTNAVLEGRRLEYKEELPGTGDGERREFLADASSFANAGGGDLIYGMRERRDEDGRPTREAGEVVGVEADNIEPEVVRLSQLLRDGIEPEMAGVAFHSVRLSSGRSCLLLRVPRSWAGLHMLTVRNAPHRFYGRSAIGRIPLDVWQIRDGFLRAATARERIQRFRAERVARIAADEMPAAVEGGPRLILHAVPLDSENASWSQFRALKDNDRLNHLLTLAGRGWDDRFNLDGFLVIATGGQGYTQLFRDGTIEA